MFIMQGLERYALVDDVVAPQGYPGKRTLTASLPGRPIQARSADAPSAVAAAEPASDVDDPCWFATGGDERTGTAPTGETGMPAVVQAKMEEAFDFDFSAVRIHQDGMAGAVGARAFAQGTDIHFGAGEYAPHDGAGQALLGHELAHVVQQAEGRVRATTQAKGVSVNDDAGLEREADEMGARAARGERVRAGSIRAPASSSDTIQRIALTTDNIAPATKVTQLIPTVRTWLETMIGLSNPQAFPVLQRHFGWVDIEHLRTDYARVLEQLEATAAAGDVAGRIDCLGGEVDETGYVFKHHSGNGARAHTEGSGSTALITFFDEAINGPNEKLGLTLVHELTHASPALLTKDIAYRHDLLYGSLGGLLSGLSRKNADTYAHALAEVLGLPTDTTDLGAMGETLGTFRVEPSTHNLAPIVLDLVKAKYGIMRRMNDEFTAALLKGDPITMITDWVKADPTKRGELEDDPRMEQYNSFRLTTGSLLPVLSTTTFVDNHELDEWCDKLMFSQALKAVDFAGMYVYLAGTNANQVLYAGEFRPISWLLNKGTVADMFTIWYGGKPLLWQLVSFHAAIEGLATEDSIPNLNLPL